MMKYMIYTNFIDGKIKQLDFHRETEHFVFMKNGERSKKITSYSEIHDTWKDAHNRLIELQSKEVARLCAQYDNECRKFTEIAGMKDETETKKEGQVTS